ncbi:MAG: TRAP transporter small permease [Lachnospiraceae bacterium]|nr:TRAP transporter small permease [Lachnospiraceae bacterium]
MDKIKTVLDKVITAVCVVFFIAMVILTTYQVVTRYVFNSPSSVSEVLTRYLFVWLILLSATYVFGQRDHICITALKNMFTGTSLKIVNIFGECVVIVFSVLILIYGGGSITSINMVQYDSILKIPTGVIYSIIPVSGVLIVFYSILNIIKYAKE